MASSPSHTEVADRARAEIADLLDLQLSPLGLAAIDRLAPQPGDTILDIGCGAGQTLLQLAERVGSRGRVIGVDIAPHVLGVSRARSQGLPQIELVEGDAAASQLPDETADGVFSRFGVMGFHDPIAAFVNLRRMTKAGGRLGFVCWRSLRENELDWLPLQAAALDVPIDATPFRFERRDYLTDVLNSAGYKSVEIGAFDASVSCGDLDATMEVLMKVGPLGRLLRESPVLRAQAEPKVRAALLEKASTDGVHLKAATWVVSARS